MNYFLDTEFIEGRQTILNIGSHRMYGPETIDLISIGIQAEDGRYYYAICSEFNVAEAWNRYDEKPNMDYKPNCGDSHYNPMYIRTYWLRDNVLMPLYKEMLMMSEGFSAFSLKTLKRMIREFGKTKATIAMEIKGFCCFDYEDQRGEIFQSHGYMPVLEYKCTPPTFYGYYSAYDWVVFCWIFGKMKELPKGFPMYCIDLKQILDSKIKNAGINKTGFETALKDIKNHPEYPQQENEHNALADARWNLKLYQFINQIK